MEGPLNLAHQQGRKADQLLAAGKFDEAIACHQKAADYLDEAITTTTRANAIESISLQKESHIKEQNVIKMKKQKAAAAEKARQKELQKLAKGQTQNKGHDLIDAATDLTDVNEEYRTMLYTTMADTDSLLHFLNNQTKKSSSGYQRLLRELSAEHHKAGSKTPKDDKQVIEELRIHNVELRRHLEESLVELEKSRNECHMLRDRLRNAEDRTLFDSGGSEPFCALRTSDMTLEELPSLELPPLDLPPKFDF